MSTAATHFQRISRLEKSRNANKKPARTKCPYRSLSKKLFQGSANETAPSAGAAASKPQRGRCGDFAEDSFRVSGNSGNPLQPEPPRCAAAHATSQGQEGVRGECTFLHSPRRLCAAFDARKRPSTPVLDLFDITFFDSLRHGQNCPYRNRIRRITARPDPPAGS